VQWLISVIPATWGDQSLRPAKAKSLQDPILNQKKLGMVMYATGSTSRRTAVQASPRKNARPYPKNKQSKKWSSTCLASTRLSLNPSTTKKKETSALLLIFFKLFLRSPVFLNISGDDSTVRVMIEQKKHMESWWSDSSSKSTSLTSLRP
jgi:hypothetical protein